MAILTGPEIERVYHESQKDDDRLPYIDISRFNPNCVGPNSYDVHLGHELKVYKFPERGFLGRVWDWMTGYQHVLIPHRDNPTETIDLAACPHVLQPGVLYIGQTEEWTQTRGLVPYIDGRSSVGRLGISIHATAGRGDDGFCGVWTLEISVIHPVMVYYGMRIGQLTYHTIEGERQPYEGRYQGSLGAVPSKFHEGERSAD